MILSVPLAWVIGSIAGSFGAVMMSLLAAEPKKKAPELAKKGDVPKKFDEKSLKESSEAALKWLNFVDAESYEKSWDEASKVLQLTVPRLQWVKILDQIRKPLGKQSGRKMSDQRVAKDPKGLPPGDYMVFFYNTQFVKHKDGYELLTLVHDNGKWQVMTYQVN